MPHPRPQTFEFSDFWGVVNTLDPSQQPAGSVPYARNLRFDKGKPRLRPGFQLWNCILDDSLTGISTWVFPRGADQPETRHLVAFGSAGDEVIDGVLNRAPLVLKQTGLAANGPDVWEVCNVNGNLIGNDLDTWTYQFKEKLYFVNGQDGLAFYSGVGYEGFDVHIVHPVAAHPGPIVGVFNAVKQKYEMEDLSLTSGKTWTQKTGEAATDHQVGQNIQEGARDAFRKDQVPWRLQINTTNADGKYIFVDTRTLGVGVDLTHTAAGIERRAKSLAVVLENTDPDAEGKSRPNFRFIIGKIDAGDITTDPDEATYAYNPDFAFAWDVTGDSLASDPLVELPLNEVPEDVLSSVDYILLMISKAPSVSTDYVLWDLSTVEAIGYVPDGIGFWRTQYRVATTNLVGNASDPVQGEVVGPDVVRQDQITTGTRAAALLGSPALLGGAGARVIKNAQIGDPVSTFRTRTFYQTPKTFVKITNTFLRSDPEELNVYRALAEPATEITDGEGGQYHFVTSVAKPAFPDVDPDVPLDSLDVVIYDNTSEAQLRANDLLDPRAQSTGLYTDPPRFISGNHRRIALGCSNAHPYRLWLSDITNELSIPNEPFTMSKDVGRGGYIDVENNETITGLTTLRDDFLIFTDNSVYRLKITFEATGDETWNLIKVATVGTHSRRGYAHIPGGIVWAAPSGFFFLADSAEQIAQVGLSADISALWQVLRKDSITAAYHPEQNIVMLGVAIGPSASADNNRMLIFDLRAKSPSTPFGAWAGDWLVTHDAITTLFYMQPKQIYVAPDRDGFFQTYILRYDKGAIDRLLIPGVDDDPYQDYGSNIRAEMWTGWVNPSLYDRFRLLTRHIRLSHDASDVDISGTLTLTAECRPPYISREYEHKIQVAFATGENAVVLGSKRRTNEFSPFLKGNQVRFKLKLSVQTGAEVRFDGLSVDLERVGMGTTEYFGNVVSAGLPDLDCIPYYVGLQPDSDQDFDHGPLGPAPSDYDDDNADPPPPMPSGLIMFWDSRNGATPNGWIPCNGLNDTPDLITGNPLLSLSTVSGLVPGVDKSFGIDLFNENYPDPNGQEENGSPFNILIDPDPGEWYREFFPNLSRYLAGQGGGTAAFLYDPSLSGEVGTATAFYNTDDTRLEYWNFVKVLNGATQFGTEIPYANFNGEINRHTHYPGLLTVTIPANFGNDNAVRYKLTPIMSRDVNYIPTEAIGLCRFDDAAFSSMTYPDEWTRNPIDTEPGGFDLSPFIQCASGEAGLLSLGLDELHLEYEHETLPDFTFVPITPFKTWSEGPKSLVNPTSHNHVPYFLTQALFGFRANHNTMTYNFGLISPDATDSPIADNIVFLWDESQGPVPAGYQVSDGTNGTLDLVSENRMVSFGSVNVQNSTPLAFPPGYQDILTALGRTHESMRRGYYGELQIEARTAVRLGDGQYYPPYTPGALLPGGSYLGDYSEGARLSLFTEHDIIHENPSEGEFAFRYDTDPANIFVWARPEYTGRRLDTTDPDTSHYETFAELGTQDAETQQPRHFHRWAGIVNAPAGSGLFPTEAGPHDFFKDTFTRYNLLPIVKVV